MRRTDPQPCPHRRPPPEGGLVPARSVGALTVLVASLWGVDVTLHAGEAARPALGADRPDVSIESVRSQLEADIGEARAELIALRKDISGERTAKSGELATLRREVMDLAGKLTEVTARASEATEALGTEARKQAHLESLTQFVDALLTEYRRAFETRISAAERQRYLEELKGVDSQAEGAPSGPRVGGAPALLRLSQRHLDAHVGNAAFAGEALGADGHVSAGRFVQLGPLSYFAADGDGPAGLAVQRLGSTRPSIVSDLLEPEEVEGIRSLVHEGHGSVPVDVTQGAALKLRQTQETVVEHLRKGGVVMVPLLLLAAVCVVLALYKSASLVRVGTAGAEKGIMHILACLRDGRTEEAVSCADALGRPLGPVIREGIEHRDASKEHIEEIMYERILSQVPALERLLAPLAVCASAAPLLGLLGTVTGMIHTFKLITVFGTGDARVLSSGISEALITTEVGLMIAVPALLVHAYLSRRVRKTIAATQQAAIGFVNGLKLKG